MNKQLQASDQTSIVADPRFAELSDLPPEAEWFANIHNPHTRRA